MGKAVGTILKIGAVVAGIALAIPSGGTSLLAATLGVSSAVATGIAVSLSIGASLLSTRPKPPKASPTSNDRLVASIDARAPRKIWLGDTAAPTDIQDQEFTDSQGFLHRFIVMASHKASQVREIWFDDKLAWTSAGGAQGEFAGYLTVTPVLEGSAANAINISARMGSTRRYTGCAYLYVRYKLTGNNKKTESPFAQAIPSRITIRGKGAPIYDVRMDSTAGGSGPQRASDQSTWAWSDDAARNPALQLLWYLLGWRINGKLAVGKGIPPERIDLDSFITAANLCDELVARSAGGTEPRYRSDGVFSEADDPGLVLDNLKAAMNAVLDDVDGKIRLTVLHNDLATPRAPLTTADVLGEFKWIQTPPLPETFNAIRGSYTDASNASLYQPIDYPEVRLPSPDGIDRIETINLPLVQSASQAQRLVKQRLQRQLYGGTFQAVFQATAWRYLKGDVVPFTFAPLGWTGKLFRIVDIEVRVDGTVPMTLREENAAIYAWDASDVAAVQGAQPTAYDYTLDPFYLDLASLGDSIEAAQQLAQDAIDAVGGFGDDASLSIEEKKVLRVRDTDLDTAWGLLNSKAAAITGDPALDTARTTAATKRANWNSFKAGLNPALTDLSLPTPVVRATFELRITEWAESINVLAEALRQNAASRADAAMAAISAISSDGVLSAGKEKADLEAEWTKIVDELPNFVARGSARGISTSAIQAAQAALAAYLGTLSPAWNDRLQNTPIVRATFDQKFRDYYAARSALQAALDANAKTQEDEALTRAAQAASDGWLTPKEKSEAEIDYQELKVRLDQLVTKFQTLGSPADVQDEVDAAGGAVYSGQPNSLGTYLYSTIDITYRGANTAVAAATYEAKWKVAYSAVSALEAALIGSVSLDIQADINAALALADDGQWDVKEKQSVLIPTNNRLETTWSLLDGKAAGISGNSALNTARTNASAARTAWLNYRNARTPAWNSLTAPTPIDRETVKTLLVDYGAKLDALAEALRAHVGVVATSALDRVTAIGLDSVIAREEKYNLVEKSWQPLNARFNALNARYVALGYPADIQPYQATAYNKIDPAVSGSLGYYLGTLSPPWNNSNADTPIDRATWQQKWGDAYTALENYAAAITGRPGPQGPQGEPGTPGTGGTTGPQTLYFSSSANAGWRSNPVVISVASGASIPLFLKLSGWAISTTTANNVTIYVQVFRQSDGTLIQNFGPTTFSAPRHDENIFPTGGSGQVSGTYTNNTGVTQNFEFKAHISAGTLAFASDSYMTIG